MSVEHYENFPVASVLCPPAIRPAVVAIYGFARTADDLADEGSADAASRLQDLAAYREDLLQVYAGRPPSTRWRAVFEALDRARLRHALPLAPLTHLLDAFEQDARNPLHEDRASLLAYCARSANPIGRLLLHLYGRDDERAVRQSDAVCTALQLVNFWQDLGVDLARGRVYLPVAEARHHGVWPEDGPQALRDSPALRALVRELCEWARELMLQGAPLATAMPGRAGWELRLVVQGGLRILDRIRELGYGTLQARPVLRARDVPLLLGRAMLMGRRSRGAES
ncbi:MAG: squalene synthase HpnC [Rubrivivax sp.]